MLDPATDSCADFSPAVRTQKYFIVAVDRDASNTLRDGTKATLTVGARPAARRAARSCSC